MNFLFTPDYTGSPSALGLALAALTACVLGLLASLARRRLESGDSALPDLGRRVFACVGMALATALLPGNTARALLLCAALLLGREDRALPALCLTGFLCGMQVPGYAAVLALCAALLWHIAARQSRARPIEALVCVTIPEELRAPDILAPVLDEYTQKHALVSMRTVELGLFFELTFLVTPREGIDTKAFLNALRGLNGNLSVSIRQTGPAPARESAAWPPRPL